MSVQASHAGHAAEPSSWIVRFAHLVRHGGTVLDLACGRGRHARLFAHKAFRVTAVDRDEAMLAGLRGAPNITPVVVDLESAPWPFADQCLDGVVVANYLHRPLLPHIAASLAPDGVLLYETFASGNEAFGRPSNPDFLLQPGELLAAFGAVVTIVAFEQGEVEMGDRRAVVQRIAAVGRARPWPPRLPGGGAVHAL